MRLRHPVWYRFAACLLLTGCLPAWHPRSPRYPTLRNGPVEVERSGFERYDPFPDKFLGPDTQVRPRSYNDQRSEPRQLNESAMRIRGMNEFLPDPMRPVPDGSSIGSRYPSSVRP